MTTVSEMNHFGWGRTGRRETVAGVYCPGRRNMLRSDMHWYTLLWCRLGFQAMQYSLVSTLSI